MHFINKGKGEAYLVCSNARRAASNCQTPSWRYGPVEALLILCLDNIDYAGLFPDLERDTRTALRELENAILEAENERDRLAKELANLGVLLARNPKQPTLEKLLNATQSAFDELSSRIAFAVTQSEHERERAQHAESDVRAVHDGLQRLHEAHKTPGADLYDLRSRLHQLLKRTLRGVTLSRLSEPDFAPGTLGARTKRLAEALVRRIEPGRSSEFIGAISVRFEAASIVQTLFVAKGFKTAVSIPLRFRKGKVHFEKNEDMAFKILRA